MRTSRATQVRQVTNLRQMGLTFKEIGERVGLASETCRKYYRDPEGLELQKLYEKRRRPCPCGRQMISNPKHSRCALCNIEATSARRKRWTRERVIGALQRYYFEHGEIPTQEKMLQRNQGHYPGTSQVAQYCGSWKQGLDDAGFPPRRKQRSQ